MYRFSSSLGEAAMGREDAMMKHTRIPKKVRFPKFMFKMNGVMVFMSDQLSMGRCYFFAKILIFLIQHIESWDFVYDLVANSLNNEIASRKPVAVDDTTIGNLRASADTVCEIAIVAHGDFVKVNSVPSITLSTIDTGFVHF